MFLGFVAGSSAEPQTELNDAMEWANSWIRTRDGRNRIQCTWVLTHNMRSVRKQLA
ncbi:MAG: hypothetical protein ACPG8W_08915 [Candidatus Promineifilaceae bacterium]